jgi:hypothetical protein
VASAPQQTVDDVKQLLQKIVDAQQTMYPVFMGAGEAAYLSVISQLGNQDPRDPNIYPPLQPGLLDPPNVTRPPDIDQKAWDTVITQLKIELDYKADAHEFFQSFYGFLSWVYISNLGYLQEALQLVEGEDSNQTAFVLTSLITVGAALISASTGMTGAPVVGGLMNFLINYLATTSNISQATISSTFADLSTNLQTSFDTALTGVQQIEQTIYENWNSLQMFKEARTSGQLVWPNPDQAFRDTALLGYKISLWQMLLPAVWHLMSSADDPTYMKDLSWIDGYIDKNPNYYIEAEPYGSGYNVYFHWLGRGDMTINTKSPSDAMCGELFTTLAIPREDVFKQQNGWQDFTQETYQHNGGCGGAQLLRMKAAADGTSPSDTAAILAALRGFRTQLQQSPMGTWYVSTYYAISDPIVSLYKQDPNIHAAIVVQYHGLDLWNAIMSLVDGNSVQITQDMIGNGLAIVAAVQQSSIQKLGESNPVNISIKQMLPYAHTYKNVTGLQDLLNIIAGQTPPSATQAAPASTGGRS